MMVPDPHHERGDDGDEKDRFVQAASYARTCSAAAVLGVVGSARACALWRASAGLVDRGAAVAVPPLAVRCPCLPGSSPPRFRSLSWVLSPGLTPPDCPLPAGQERHNCTRLQPASAPRSASKRTTRDRFILPGSPPTPILFRGCPRQAVPAQPPARGCNASIEQTLHGGGLAGASPWPEPRPIDRSKRSRGPALAAEGNG